jgi:hypothetical protein
VEGGASGFGGDRAIGAEEARAVDHTRQEDQVKEDQATVNQHLEQAAFRLANDADGCQQRD